MMEAQLEQTRGLAPKSLLKMPSLLPGFAQLLRGPGREWSPCFLRNFDMVDPLSEQADVHAESAEAFQPFSEGQSFNSVFFPGAVKL